MPRILLVEDNELNRDMLSRRLQRRGFDVLIAEDGARGIEVARASHPELILMDMDLPVVDGWEATRRLKADPASRNIPIIALTAHALQTDCDRAFEAGCDDFATKPIEFAALLDKITKALETAPRVARGGEAGL
jgi:CheY-like chemotaxis protein